MRTRYTPRFRPSGGLLGVAPWVDLVLVFVFFLLIETRVTVRPGTVIELPETSATGGLQSGAVALVALERGVDGRATQVIYLDDSRYEIERDHQALAVALTDMRRGGDVGLVLYADKRVPQETVVDLIGLARAAGFQRVALATRPAEGGGALGMGTEP